MITISINDEFHSVAADQTVTQLLASLPPRPTRYAVAINENFIPKSAYDSTFVQDGDRLELLVAMQGG